MNEQQLQEKIRAAVGDADRRTNYELGILHGLQFKHNYQGTVPPAVVEKRRRDNRVARKSRRINRRR